MGKKYPKRLTTPEHLVGPVPSESECIIMTEKNTPFNMTDEGVDRTAGEVQTSCSMSQTPQIATSPGISDSLAALTLSTSLSTSDGKPQSITVPEIGEHLTEWLEDELNVRWFFAIPPPWVAHVPLLVRPLPRASASLVHGDSISHPKFVPI
jgi:hypothetical protein